MPSNNQESKHLAASQLCEAVEQKSLHKVNTLLESEGADPNLLVLDKGICPFHLVIGSESYQFAEEATRAFLQHNGNPNVRSDDGLTPLHVAAVWGRTGILQLLLLCGGDPWLKDFETGLTPLHLALKEKHFETALVLQRHQLLNRRKVNHDGVARCCKISLETIVVNAGEMLAEYGTLQDNVSPVLMSPVQEIKKKNGSSGLNIEAVESQEYVHQWWYKEFSPQPITSTPTHLIPPVPSNTVIFDPIQSSGTFSPTYNDCGSNALRLNELDSTVAPKNCLTTAPVDCIPNRNTNKSTTDVRKKLFLELKKCFSGIKHSIETSREDNGKNSEYFSKSTLSYFLRKKKPKSIQSNCENWDDNPSRIRKDDFCFHDHVECSLNPKSSDSQEFIEQEDNRDTNGTYYNFKANVDDVDAIPLNDKADVSLEWVASNSCFTEDLSPDSTTSQLYVTCDEGSVADRNILESKGDVSHSFDMKRVLSEEYIFKAPERPPRRKQFSTLNATALKTESESPTIAAFGSVVSEECRYRDSEAGIALIENHVLPKPLEVLTSSDNGSVVSIPLCGGSDPGTAFSDVSSIPASFNYDSDVLRKKLTAHGETVGPITFSTKRVYLRRLYQLQEKTASVAKPVLNPYTPELQKLLKCVEWEEELLTYCKLEAAMCAHFDKPDPSRCWRGGVIKSSFNYLLLDPRISLNLPAIVHLHDQSTLCQFISSIFYVGKGKRSRPYSHLYEAVHIWNKGCASEATNPKVKRILDIWSDGKGVVCLHIFLNIIPVEAFTREAAMLDALGLTSIGNLKMGEYYGPASTWRIRQKRQLGAYLLYKAMKVFLSEGERQLRPADIN